MYLLYEHHKDEQGNLLATDMLMSSFYPGKPGINFRKATENAFFEFTKTTFKAVHISQRSYDPDTKIWSFFGSSGSGVYKALKESPFATIGLSFQKIEDLSSQVKGGYVSKPEKAFAFDASDFFYTPEPPKSSGPSKADATKQLAQLLGVPEAEITRKVYLRAALAFHPDRNNGDGSRMTELNFLWQVYNG